MSRRITEVSSLTTWNESQSPGVVQGSTPYMLSPMASTPLPVAGSHQDLLEIIRRHQEDELAHFFRSICSAVRQFKPANVIKIKRILSTAVHLTEEEELQEQEKETVCTLASWTTSATEEVEESDLDDDVFE